MNKWVGTLVVALGTLLVPADSVPTLAQQRWAAGFANQPQAQQQLAVEFWQQQRRSAAYYWWQRALQNGSDEAYKALQKHFPEQSSRYVQIAVEQGNRAAIQQLALEQLDNPLLTWQQWLQRWSQRQYRDALLAPFDDLWRWLPLPAQPSCQKTLRVYPQANGSKRLFVELLAGLSQSSFSITGLCFALQPEAAVPHQPQEGDEPPIILADSGGASLNHQRMVLTADSNGLVLAHELGHLLGLGDEYELRPELAQVFCRGHYQTQVHNLVMTEKRLLSSAELQQLWQRLPWRTAVADWRLLAQQQANGLWQLGSDRLTTEIGLYPAATCDAVEGVYAWKAVAKTTAMERHQTDYWPALYERLLYNARAN